MPRPRKYPDELIQRGVRLALATATAISSSASPRGASGPRKPPGSRPPFLAPQASRRCAPRTCSARKASIALAIALRLSRRCGARAQWRLRSGQPAPTPDERSATSPIARATGPAPGFGTGLRARWTRASLALTARALRSERLQTLRSALTRLSADQRGGLRAPALPPASPAGMRAWPRERSNRADNGRGCRPSAALPPSARRLAMT
jgi:hypothetical protein